MTNFPPRIDLFSDTKTRPSKRMLEVMMGAQVGDEQADEDPTTLSLCEKVAELMGKEKAIFLPSGTMCNQIALAVQCRGGDEIIAEETAHIINSEAGGAATVAGAMIHPIKGRNGIFQASQLEEAIRPALRHSPKSKMVVIEQTSNLGGGSVWPLKTVKDVATIARNNGLLVHMDGARLMNAVVASDISAKEFAAFTDTTWIDFSKGLGCPIGGVLAGSQEFIEEAWLWKQRLGGAMRQSGILASAGIFALDNNVLRLAEDHENAKVLAERLAQIDCIEINAGIVETNIILLKVNEKGLNAVRLAEELLKEGIRIGALDEYNVRLVTHLDVNREDIIEVADSIESVVKTLMG